MLTKRKLKRWYGQARHAYEQGVREVQRGDQPYGMAYGTQAAYERGKKDARTKKRTKRTVILCDGRHGLRLPTDLWLDVLATHLRWIAW